MRQNKLEKKKVMWGEEFLHFKVEGTIINIAF